MENSEDREGYSLACGFSLGLVLLGMGNENLPGLDDLKLSDRLASYFQYYYTTVIFSCILVELQFFAYKFLFVTNLSPNLVVKFGYN